MVYKNWIQDAREKIASVDQTHQMLSSGYPFVFEQCRERGKHVFSTRLMLKKVTCMTGREAARLFYDSSKFRRSDAAPALLKKTLFGEGGVQGLDGSLHRSRKNLFLSCLGRDELAGFVEVFETCWWERLERWQSKDRVVWLDEMVQLLCQSALRWCRIECDDLELRASQFRLLIEGPAAFGAKHLRARSARHQLDAWLERIVERRRASGIPWGTHPLDAFASYQENGERLSARTVAVELNNIVRPIAALAWFLVAAELAREAHPDLLPPDGDVREETYFINEVRRLHPFFPMVGARAERDLVFEGEHIPRGRLVLLDLYGTNRDPDVWADGEVFRPWRYGESEDPFPVHAFVPQGGGEHATGHRCAGEWLTIETMRSYLRLRRHLNCKVFDQDTELVGIPARPRSGLLLGHFEPQALPHSSRPFAVASSMPGDSSSRPNPR